VRRAARPEVVAVVLVACAVYLPLFFWPRSFFYTDVLSTDRLLAVGGLAKVACLAAGSVFAFLVARRLGPKNPVRRPWGMLGIWFALWAIAQLMLMGYHFVLHVPAPVPSLADALFYVGFIPFFAGLVEFIVVYLRSGFPIGSPRALALTAAATAAGLTAVAAPLLVPMARAGGATLGNLTLAVYPALDLVAVVPAIVLLRIALAFRPGRVWLVWLFLAGGLVLMAVGDVLMLYEWPTGGTSFEPLVHLMYLLGYYFAAQGLRLQWELLAT
jgi:hypothetical protein